MSPVVSALVRIVQEILNTTTEKKRGQQMQYVGAKLNHVKCMHASKCAYYSTCTMHFEEQIDENKQII